MSNRKNHIPAKIAHLEGLADVLADMIVKKKIKELENKIEVQSNDKKINPTNQRLQN